MHAREYYFCVNVSGNGLGAISSLMINTFLFKMVVEQKILAFMFKIKNCIIDIALSIYHKKDIKIKIFDFFSALISTATGIVIHINFTPRIAFPNCAFHD